MICSCCGFEIKGDAHPVENGQRHVCEKCWNDPEMFFPEKIKQDQRLTLLSKMAEAKENQNGLIEVAAIKLVQKNIEMYVGKMKVNDVLSLYELDKFKEEELEGYQRERYEERTSQLVEYLEKSPLAVMPAILVGLRKTNFVSIDGDLGVLRIDRKKGALWIIDGQHRVGGFSKIRDRFMFSKSLGASLFSDLMDYEFPVVFVDSQGAAEKIKGKESKLAESLSAEDIEKTIFFVVNKTQRGISPSLKDALLYSIKTSGIEGLSIVDREGWRIVGAQIGITLNCKENSPLRAKINVSGQRNSGKPVQLNSFVSSLETLFKDKDFSNLATDDKICFLEAFWSALRALIPDAFEGPEKHGQGREEFGKRFSSNIGRKSGDRKSRKDESGDKKYLLLTALGIYVAHRLARDLLHAAIEERFDFRQPELLKEKLAPVKAFDWKAKTSPLSALGGMKGVGRAYDLLSEVVGQEKYSPNAEKPLGTYSKERKPTIDISQARVEGTTIA
jgi:DGQHR domain-containing protein